MGTAEAIPFGTEAGAEAFVAEKGGRIVSFDAVPEAYVRPAEIQAMESPQ
jgi:copper chaperone NosL